MGGKEKVFQINLELQCKISFKMQMQQITHQRTILYCFFFNNFNNLIFNVFEDKNDFLKEKLCSLFKKDPHYANESTENQKTNEQAMIKPNPLFQ
jgi:hypothetical protein